VAIVGTWVGSEEEISGRMENRAAAFISFDWADGPRIIVARVMGEEPDAVPNLVARYLVRQISRDVQVPNLVDK